jgi:hypothetical protein
LVVVAVAADVVVLEEGSGWFTLGPVDDLTNRLAR